MSRHCGRFAEQAARLAAAQRKFLNAWKGVQAGGRARLPEARRARVALEEAFVLTRRALYQAWFPRDLPTVVDKTDYQQVDEFDIGNEDSYDFAANEDGSFYTRRRMPSGSALYLWNPERSRNAIALTKQLSEKSVTTFMKTPDGNVIVAANDFMTSKTTVYKMTHAADGSYTTHQELFRHDAYICDIQPLYDGRILTGDNDGSFNLWARGQDGVWERSFVGRQPSSVTCMQMMEDDRIISGGELGDVILWKRNVDDEGYKPTIISWKGSHVHCLQGWHDGSVVSGYEDGIVLLSIPRPNGSFYNVSYDTQVGSVRCLQRISDDRIVVGLWSGEIVQLNVVNESLQVAQVIGDHRRSSNKTISVDESVINTPVRDLQMMADGRMYSIGNDDLVRVWDGMPVQDTEDVEQSAP